MFLKIINFATYTSLKIGTPLPVWVLERSDEVAFGALGSHKVWDRLDKLEKDFLEKLTQAKSNTKADLSHTNLDLSSLASDFISLNSDLGNDLASEELSSNEILENEILGDKISSSEIFKTKQSTCGKQQQSLKSLYTCIGNGYNLLVSPNAKHLVMLSPEFDYILTKDTLQNPKDSSEVIEVGGKTSSSSLFRFCKQHNLGGLEFLRSLPGSVGGLVKMNAGMKQYEIKDTLLEVCIDGIWRSDFTLSYRSSDIAGIISAARFRLKKGFDSSLLAQFQAMRSTHPKEPSCGSCFRNPSGDYAGRLIEAVGLKGAKQNGVGFSSHHANFLVNFGTKSTQASPTQVDSTQTNSTKTNFTKIDSCQAEFADALAMIELAKKRVKERFGIELVPEVQIVH